LHEAAHVLAADERDMVAEALLVLVEQCATVAVFFLLHVAEHRGSRGVIGLETLGEIAVNAAVFLFRRNGDGENLTLRKALERSHDRIVRLSRRTEGV